MSIAAFPSSRKHMLLVTLIAALVPLVGGAQEAGDASSIESASLAVASTWPMLAPLPQGFAIEPAAVEPDAAPADGATFSDARAGNDDDASMSGPALDDQVLSRQRGGRPGMVMVAATPQRQSGNAVTLWDEIAPPTAPQPVPVDAGRAAQGNVVIYTRK